MRNVVERYPVDKLPADLRQGITATHVRVVVETEGDQREADRLFGLMDELSAEARRTGLSAEKLAELLGMDEDEKRNVFGS